MAASGQPPLIIAGSGTGKTTTLAHRFASLVRDRHVPPDRCLAITFTRKAAGQLGERLAGLLGEPGQRITAVTFHRLALDILREQYRTLGFTAPPRVTEGEEAHDGAAAEPGSRAGEPAGGDVPEALECGDIDRLIPLALEALRDPDVAAV